MMGKMMMRITYHPGILSGNVSGNFFNHSYSTKIGTHSVHVGSLSKVSQDPCVHLYAQTQANCNALFDVGKKNF